MSSLQAMRVAVSRMNDLAAPPCVTHRLDRTLPPGNSEMPFAKLFIAVIALAGALSASGTPAQPGDRLAAHDPARGRRADPGGEAEADRLDHAERDRHPAGDRGAAGREHGHDAEPIDRR